jgi:hypothetical protein
MREDLDLFVQGNRLSIKDLDDDLDISDSKWDFIFEYLVKEAPEVYFEGWHLDSQYTDEINSNLLTNVEYLAEKVFIDKNGHHILLFKVKLSAIMLNRSLLSRVWLCYDYPSLIFMRDTSEESKLVESSNQMPKRNTKAISILKNAFIAFRSSQYDVLWVEKSNDLVFPWKTERSPRALEKDVNRSWFEKLMNSIGFYWHVKIKRK